MQRRVATVLTYMALAVAASVAITPLWAQDQAAVPDPPTEVGDVSRIEGKLSVTPLAHANWQTASINYPVSTGEGFFTDGASRA